MKLIVNDLSVFRQSPLERINPSLFLVSYLGMMASFNLWG